MWREKDRFVAYWFVACWFVAYWFVAYWFVAFWIVAYWFVACWVVASGTCPGRRLLARGLLVRCLLDRDLLVRCLLVRDLLVRCLLVRGLSIVGVLVHARAKRLTVLKIGAPFCLDRSCLQPGGSYPLGAPCRTATAVFELTASYLAC